MVGSVGAKVRSSAKSGILSPLLLTLRSLATRIPKIVLSRIEEKYPELWTGTVKILNKQITTISQESNLKNIETQKHHGERREDSMANVSIVTHSKNVEEIQIHRQHMCYVCNRNFKNNNQLETHLISHNSNLISCKVCDKYCEDVSKLNEHYKIHRKKRNHECEVCGKKFIRDRNLKNHMTIHLDTFPFECTTCRKKFKDNKNLRDHYVIHSNQRNYVCDKCNKSFQRKSYLRIHNKFVHAKGRLYICKVCDMSFKHGAYMKTHMLLHENKKPFACTRCNKSFRQNTHLRVHISTVHLKKRNYKCDQCGNDFTQSSHLNTHVRRVHDGEKPYVCNECDTAFACKQALDCHWRSHFGIRSHQCPHCPYSCVQKNALMIHIKRVHLQCPKCDVCGKTFKTIEQCRKHVVIHTDL